MNTYQELNQNENRAISLTLYDQNGDAFAPSAAFATVKNDVGTTVVVETVATVSSNTITATISTTVTATPGEYSVIWRILQSSYTYYHKTKLIVQEL